MLDGDRRTEHTASLSKSATRCNSLGYGGGFDGQIGCPLRRIGGICASMDTRRSDGCTQSLPATKRSIRSALRSGQWRVPILRPLSRRRKIRDYHADRWGGAAFIERYRQGLRYRRIY